MRTERSSRAISSVLRCFRTKLIPPKDWLPPRAANLLGWSLRIASPQAKNQKEFTGETIEGERALLINAVSGLKYDKTLIEAKANEPLALTLKNVDVMPHNLVIVAEGSARKVGDASFKMLSDPKAGEKTTPPT